MNRINNMDNACVVAALLHVSQKDEATVIRVCKAHGFNEKRGMSDPEWLEAARVLGVKIDPLRIALNFPSENGYRQYNIQKMFSDTNVYLIATKDHLFCLDRGTIIDPRCDSPNLGRRRIIRQIWRIITNES